MSEILIFLTELTVDLSDLGCVRLRDVEGATFLTVDTLESIVFLVGVFFDLLEACFRGDTGTFFGRAAIDFLTDSSFLKAAFILEGFDELSTNFFDIGFVTVLLEIGFETDFDTVSETDFGDLLVDEGDLLRSGSSVEASVVKNEPILLVT